MTALLKISALTAARALSILSAIRDGERPAPAPLTVSTTERNTPDDEINSFLSDIRAAYGLITDSSTAARAFVAYLTESANLDNHEIYAVKDVEQFFYERARGDLIAAAIEDLDDALGIYADDPEAAADLTLEDVSFDCLEDAIKSEAEPMIEALDIKKYFDEEGAAVGAYVLAADLTLEDVSFDCLEDAIKSEAEPMIEALDIKKYFDEEGAAVGAYVLIECLTLEDVSFDCLEDAIKSEAEPMIEALDIKKYFDEEGAAVGAYVLIECGGPTLYFHWLDSAGAYISATGRTTGGSATRRLGLEDLEIINQLYFFGELDI